MPKIIFMDPGLAAFLAGWESVRDLQLSPSAGHYLETYVISEIVKDYNARGIRPNLSYYRDIQMYKILRYLHQKDFYKFDFYRNC